MAQRAIPCLLMRGGTSRGPFFRRSDLPQGIAERDHALLAAIGSPDPRQIDGLGGGDSLTSKVAMISPSTRDGVDVDYLFAQVSVDRAAVDTQPSCGNMLAGVGPAAIEMGLVPANDGETRIVIHNENTGSRIEVVVQTPGGRVRYDGELAIDGVSGAGAPIAMNFSNLVGSKTGAMFPTGRTRETILGIEVSCVDVAMPMVQLRACDVGVSGDETRDQINADTALLKRIEEIRLEAGRRMGLGDVSGMVIPKVGLLGPARNGGNIRSWYLTPHDLHAAHAVTGAICVASAARLDGTIANELAATAIADGPDFSIEHPSGTLAVRVAVGGVDAAVDISAGILRTARLIMRGEVMVPA
jgi:4-oxalomesaconate tautomerase